MVGMLKASLPKPERDRFKGGENTYFVSPQSGPLRQALWLADRPSN